MNYLKSKFLYHSVKYWYKDKNRLFNIYFQNDYIKMKNMAKVHFSIQTVINTSVHMKMMRKMVMAFIINLFIELLESVPQSGPVNLSL